jgi:hypothetical protein
MKTPLILLSTVVVMTAMPVLANEMTAQEKAQHYMHKIDTNGDSQISLQEHDSYGKMMFEEADANDDSMISMSELTTHKQQEKDKMKSMEKTGGPANNR